MASEDAKSITETDGKKLWVFWVFGLGFFAGFLVSLVMGDRLKPTAEHKAEVASSEQAAPESHPTSQAGHDEEPSRMPEAHEGIKSDVKEVVMTKAMRDRLLTFDFISLLQDAEIRRYRFEGEMKGIVLNKIRTGSIYEKIGFKNGDIIEQINGIALADLNRRAEEMRETLPGADRIEFRVRRDDKVRTIRVKVAGPGDH